MSEYHDEGIAQRAAYSQPLPNESRTDAAALAGRKHGQRRQSEPPAATGRRDDRHWAEQNVADDRLGHRSDERHPRLADGAEPVYQPSLSVTGECGTMDGTDGHRIIYL